jgi:hypothetical protein
MSAAMLVRIYEPALDTNGTFFLKLYDRCCGTVLRDACFTSYPDSAEVQNLIYLTAKRDMKYFKHLLTEDGAARLRMTINTAYDEDLPSIYGENDDHEPTLHEYFYRGEVEMHERCVRFANTEPEVYRRLQDLQGKVIPRVIAEMELPGFYSSRYCSPTVSSEMGGIQGLLLECIEDFTLYDVGRPWGGRFDVPPVPREQFGLLIERTLDTLRTIMARGILNRDIRPNQTIIR